MSVRRLAADALHLIDEHASAMPEGAYLELMNKMKRIYDQAHEPGAPKDVIGHLVGLLRGGTEDYGLIAACVRALSDLVDFNEDTEATITSAGGIQALIALLSINSDEVKVEAVARLLPAAHRGDQQSLIKHCQINPM